jgi:hypothetical protein
MRLSQLLEKLPVKALDNMRYSCGLDRCADSEAGEAGRIEELSGKLLSDVRLEAELAHLKPWAAVILKLLVVFFGPLPFEKDSLERAALTQGYSGAHVKAALAILRSSSMIFVLRKSWGEEQFILPEDALPVWHKLLFSSPLQEEHSAAVREHGEAAGNAGCAAYDVLMVLDMARNGELKLKKQGDLAKPALKKLKDNLIVLDEDLEASCVEARPPHQYGPAAEAVLHLAFCSGLLTENGLEWQLRGPYYADWLKRPLEDVQRELYRCWIEAARTGEVWELHALSAIEQAPPNRWYMVDQLFEWLRVCGMINGTDSAAEERFVRTRLLPMQAMGWIRLSRLPAGLVFQLPFPLSTGDTWCNKGYEGLIVQPDLEIVIPPYPSLALLSQMMFWCIPVSRGECSVYRLTRESVRKALELGGTSTDLIASLTGNSMLPVDSRVIQAVEEWSGRHRAVIQTGVTLLRLEDPFVCALLESGERFPEILLERIGSGIYLVEECHVAPLLAELNKLGVVALRPKTMTSSEIPIDSPPAAPILVSRLLSPVSPPVAPELHKVSGEEWKDIPAAWWKDSAHYHPSTEKELIRTAIEHKTVVGLAKERGLEEMLVPLALREDSCGWSVEGMLGNKSVNVRPTEWKAIRLVLPGFND